MKTTAAVRAELLGTPVGRVLLAAPDRVSGSVNEPGLTPSLIARQRLAAPAAPRSRDANGRYLTGGDGPEEVHGCFVVRTAGGDQPNPLRQADADVDLLFSP